MGDGERGVVVEGERGGRLVLGKGEEVVGIILLGMRADVVEGTMPLSSGLKEGDCTVTGGVVVVFVDVSLPPDPSMSKLPNPEPPPEVVSVAIAMSSARRSSTLLSLFVSMADVAVGERDT